jgi:undecaprenyl-diphosphatase
VSRVGDGWIWFAIVVFLPIVDGPVGTSASVRLVGVGSRQPDPLQDHQALDRAAASVPDLPGDLRADALARRVQLPERPRAALHGVQRDPPRVLPALGAVVWPLTILIALSRIVLGLHYPSDVIVGALIGGITAAVSFNLL